MQTLSRLPISISTHTLVYITRIYAYTTVADGHDGLATDVAPAPANLGVPLLRAEGDCCTYTSTP